MHVRRQRRLQSGNDRAFHRSDVRDDGPGFKSGRDRAADRFVGAEGSAEDHAIGVPHRVLKIARRLVAERQRLHPVEHVGRPVGQNDAPRRPPAARRPRDRGADQPDADNRQLFEQRLFERRHEPVNHHRPA